MIKRDLIRAAAMSAALITGACTPQMTADALAGAAARCREAQALYDADPNAKAAVLTLAACIR